MKALSKPGNTRQKIQYMLVVHLTYETVSIRKNTHMSSSVIANSLDPASLQALDRVEVNINSKSNEIIDRIIDAYEVSSAYAETVITDPEHKKAQQIKLLRSDVNGSYVAGIRNADEVKHMLRTATGWTVVMTTMEDRAITCIQGEFSAEVEAFAAYATIRELYAIYGSGSKGAQMLGEVKVRKGFQQKDEFFHSTTLRCPTNIVTVHLKPDLSGIEFMARWFAGREKTSIPYFNEGDTIVRCNSTLTPHRGPANAQKPRFQRR